MRETIQSLGEKAGDVASTVARKGGRVARKGARVARAGGRTLGRFLVRAGKKTGRGVKCAFRNRSEVRQNSRDGIVTMLLGFGVAGVIVAVSGAVSLSVGGVLGSLATLAGVVVSLGVIGFTAKITLDIFQP